MDISEENPEPFERSLSHLHFSFLPDDGFDAGSEPLAANGATLWWLRFENDNTSMGGNYPVLFEPGMDGYYFSIDQLYLLDENPSLRICKSKDADAQSCRTFSVTGLREAIAFVCRMEIKG